MATPAEPLLPFPRPVHGARAGSEALLILRTTEKTPPNFFLSCFPEKSQALLSYGPRLSLKPKVRLSPPALYLCSGSSTLLPPGPVRLLGHTHHQCPVPLTLRILAPQALGFTAQQSPEELAQSALWHLLLGQDCGWWVVTEPGEPGTCRP